MIFLKFGFRSLFRQKRRTSITLLVITFGIGCLLLALGHSRFIGWGLRESTIHSETGHLQVFNQHYFEHDEETILQNGLDDYEEIRSELNRMIDVSVVLARIELMGLISNGEKSVACIGQGVEPEQEKRMRGLFGLSASMYDPFIGQHEAEVIALGNGLARSLSVKQGDYVILMTTTADGALNALDLKVVGTFTGFSPEYDERAIVIPLKTAQMLLNTHKVKNLVITLNETAKTDFFYDKISSLAEEKKYLIVLKKWHEQAVYYKKVKQFYKQLTGFLTLALFILVFFSTSNTIVMAILERIKEIGSLLSLGTSRWQTLKMFFFEGLFIGIVGGIISMLFAFGLSSLINGLDIMLPSPPGLTEGYPLMIRNEWGFYIQIFLATIFVTTLSSFLPALRATRMNIVEAIRHI